MIKIILFFLKVKEKSGTAGTGGTALGGVSCRENAIGKRNSPPYGVPVVPAVPTPEAS